ncbi:MAG: M1 family metallopeptidase [Gemmatimonadota bacterium]|nr:M1 family metallopeptidase [Gemmatimonadota bacterium]
MLTIMLSALLLQGAIPSPAYWQQEVRYDIRARLDEPSGVLAGSQRMMYVNRSPDTLGTISFHLHLNAFRPGSRWSAADSAERRRRFNDLKEPDYGFNRIANVRIMGRPVEPIWPLAPDSTIVRFLLPAPLAPGDSTVVEMDWSGRPSTTVRRQGRRGRQLDFAHSYPKVVVYDRAGWHERALEPAGEFYGEFATYLVDLDVAEDQVLGATGVPLCGDPGWAGANQVPDRPIHTRRDFYPAAPACPDLAAEPGRKRVVWYAEDVHHWALSLNPEYRYEGSAWGDVAIHVLYRPGDEATWGGGLATNRTAKALQWLDFVFGKFAWPQITAVHRLDGGGTEFPMMMHNGSASQGLIIHELGHNYTQGILANNEGLEGWLDEGFSDFQGALFDESEGREGFSASAEARMTGWDLDGMTEPASLDARAYRDFNSYNIGVYSRGELFFHQLRYLVGDEALLRILRTFYDRWKLKHVDEAAFRTVAEEVSGRNLSDFFAQGLHDVVLADFAVGKVRVVGRGGAAAPPPPKDAGWETTVEVLRKGEARLPVEVWVLGESDTAMARTPGVARSERVTVSTRSKPREVLLDPRRQTRDWNLLNNAWRRGWPFASRRPKPDHYFDTGLSQPIHRDRGSAGWMPAGWYNDAAGITLGFRSRSDYFGRFEQNQLWMSYGTGWESDRNVEDLDFHLRLRNPTALHRPGESQTLEAFRVEGRFGARLGWERTRREHLGWGPVHSEGMWLSWIQVGDDRYLDRGYYDDAGTVELALSRGIRDQLNGWRLSGKVTVAGGLAYNSDGLAAATGRSDLDEFYGRFLLDARAGRTLATKWGVAGRFYAGMSTSGSPAVKQRQVYLAGADPMEQFSNPFLRSSGALFVRPDVYYHAPGGAGLRGFDPRLSAEAVLGFSAELERYLVDRPQGKLFRRVSIAAFGDAGQVLFDEAANRPEGKLGALADLGVGLRATHMVGQTLVTTRFDFPLIVSRPELAQDASPDDVAGFRWSFSFSPSW